jgi:hypothetical protein
MVEKLTLLFRTKALHSEAKLPIRSNWISALQPEAIGIFGGNYKKIAIN